MRMRSLALGVSAAVALLCVAGGVQAAAPSSRELAEIQAAIARGAFSEAIAQLEQWSDQGFVHPDASFGRPVSHQARHRSDSLV